MKTRPRDVAAVLAVAGMLGALAVACGPGGDMPQAQPGRESDGGAGAEAPANEDASGGGPDGSVQDAAPGADASATCSRELAARPAPASLFDTFTKDLAGLTGAARTARVTALMADVAAQGGAPLEDPATGRVIFLARGDAASGPWSVATSLTGFDAANATPLVMVPDTDLWAADVVIPRGKSFEYKLLTGSTFVEDRAARTVVWDGVPRAESDLTRGQYNAVGHPMDWDKARGRLVRHGRVHATKLANDRDVLVYLPARYDDGSCGKLPSIVLHDGNETLTRGDMARAADTLYAARPELSAVLVFADNAGTLELRIDEYSFGYGSSKAGDYLDFLVADLWPSITSAGYRLCSKAAARGLAGASLGGLVSTFAVFEKPGQWGWVGAQSPAYYWSDDAMITRVAGSPKVDARFYMDSGDDNADDVDHMATAMTGKAYEFVRFKQNGGTHEWASFATRFGGMLTHFRDGRSDCD